jgi:hypothetical protein
MVTASSATQALYSQTARLLPWCFVGVGMRTIEVRFPSGREVLGSYWGFLEHGGLVLKDPVSLSEGEAVLVEVRIQSLKQTYRLEGRVVRRGADGRRAFIAFNGGQDQQSMLNAAWADTHDVPQRKHRRYPSENEVSYAARGNGNGDEPHRGRLINVSPGGCRLRGSTPLPVGARLVVNASGILLEGQVRWCTPGNEMGIEFDRPEMVVQTLLDRY